MSTSGPTPPEKNALSRYWMNMSRRAGTDSCTRARRQFAPCRAALRINLCERLGCSNPELSFRYLKHSNPFATVNGVPSVES